MPSPPPRGPSSDWRPRADLLRLRQRSQLYREIRQFFEQRQVLEVETPLLAAGTVTDLHLHSLSCQLKDVGGWRQLFLQTSPEFAMKRLLAADSGPIFQICKAFRDDEQGAMHNPEFTMLEWYRPGFDHHRLMDEMDELLGQILAVPAAERRTYGELFESALGVDPHVASPEALAAAAEATGVAVAGFADAARDAWLHLLWSHRVEPSLGTAGRPTFVLDFPASQAALARLRPADPATARPAVAERFEVYVDGVELANGFHELADREEQLRRFEADNEARRRADLPAVPIDHRLLDALGAGIGDCAGVALGIDRLLMLRLGVSHIDEVLAFPVARA